MRARRRRRRRRGGCEIHPGRAPVVLRTTTYGCKRTPTVTDAVTGLPNDDACVAKPPRSYPPTYAGGEVFSRFRFSPTRPRLVTFLFGRRPKSIHAARADRGDVSSAGFVDRAKRSRKRTWVWRGWGPRVVPAALRPTRRTHPQSIARANSNNGDNGHGTVRRFRLTLYLHLEAWKSARENPATATFVSAVKTLPTHLYTKVWCPFKTMTLYPAGRTSTIINGPDLTSI